MKTKLLFLCLAISALGIAQQSYYNDVDLTKVGTALRDELGLKVTNTHTNFLTYTPGIWEASKITDQDPNNANNVLLIYGWEDGSDGNGTNDRSRSKNSNGGANGDWNREHTYPRSLGVPNLGSEGPGADAHHLRPADVQENSNRGNRKFADGNGNASITAQGDWYPGDEWKGDVARMVLYMYIRYGARCLPRNVAIGTTNEVDPDMVDLLLAWNAEDPVSTLEDNRNAYHDSNDTYAQGNRNPFIDNPYLATRIWGGPTAQDRWGIATPDTEAPTTPTNLMTSTPTANSIQLAWTAATDNVGVIQYTIYVDGVLNSTATTTSTTITNLAAETTYAFTVTAKDVAGNTSAQSTPASGTTTAIPTGGNELFISEYVEGSGFNKAIEIANFTGQAIDLTPYTVSRQGSGAGDWETPLALSGTIENGDVIVIINDDTSDTTLLSEADVLIANETPMTFNGNDPVGLFKDGTLIDIVGTLNGGSANFAKDITLRRKSTVTTPNTNFDIAGEWDEYPRNEVADIGSHTVSTLSIGAIIQKATVAIYPNPSSTDTIWVRPLTANGIEKVLVYDMTGKLLQSQKEITQPTPLSGLPKGMLLVVIEANEGIQIQKIIIQ